MRRTGARATGRTLLALALAACGRPTALGVDHAWVRLAAVPGRPAAAYFTVHGGAADATLVRVTTPEARAAEMHESMANGMRPITGAPVPASGTIAFAPVGRHVMLFDLNPHLRPGQHLPLTLAFADGRQLTARAELVGPADPAPR